MTKTFDRFLKQFNSTGNDKAQGYDESHFDGLNEDEKKKVFELLESELIAPGVIGWLFRLDANRAENTLKNYITKHSGMPTSGLHRIYIALFHFTNNEIYLDYFERDFHSYYEWEKEDALQLYAAYTSDDSRKKSFLNQVMAAEKGNN